MDEPAPKSTRTTEIHSSPSPAVSVTTGARNVIPAKVAAFTSAPSGRPSHRYVVRGRLAPTEASAEFGSLAHIAAGIPVYCHWRFATPR
jgi:hypothetical protein